MAQNKRFMYNSIPQGWPKAGTDLTIETVPFDLATPAPPNGFTTNNVFAAYDPSQRARMRDPCVQSYNQAMSPGEPVQTNHMISRVLKSQNPRFKPGDLVSLIPWSTETFSVVSEEAAKKAEILLPATGVPLTAYMGALGMTGMTAYGSLYEIGQPKKGETILVSAAAGAVGQVVGQIALKEGLRVIGSVGDDAKLDYIVNTLGFTAGFNYKKESMAQAVKRLAADGIDIYYDNVGGELLSMALDHMKPFGRIVACGAISQYNVQGNEAYGITNYTQIFRRRIKWQGFIVIDPNILKHAEARDRNISRWIVEGSFKNTDHITVGMDNAIEGFLGMLRGTNLGRSILQISDYPATEVE